MSKTEIQRETEPFWLTLFSSALLWQAPSFTEVCTCNNKAPFLSSHLVAWDLPDLMSRCLHLFSFLFPFSLWLRVRCDVCRQNASCFSYVCAVKSTLTNRIWQTSDTAILKSARATSCADEQHANSKRWEKRCHLLHEVIRNPYKVTKRTAIEWQIEYRKSLLHRTLQHRELRKCL